MAAGFGGARAAGTTSLGPMVRASERVPLEKEPGIGALAEDMEGDEEIGCGPETCRGAGKEATLLVCAAGRADETREDGAGAARAGCAGFLGMAETSTRDEVAATGFAAF